MKYIVNTSNDPAYNIALEAYVQDYRDTGLLGYVQLPGKIIYRESDIMDLLERFYQK